MRAALTIGLACLTSVVSAAAYLYDAGAENSAVMNGFTRVTAKDVYSPEKGFGWDAAKNMKPYVKAYGVPDGNEKRKNAEPPPIYTNPLTEDCIVGASARTFRVDLPAGAYSVYLLCGTSYDMEGQYFDFQVRIQDETRRVLIENSYQFRSLRLSVKTNGEPLGIVFEPHSKWVLNGIMIWSGADEGGMNQMIREMEEQVYGLPRAELAKWKQEPLPPTPPLPEEARTSESLRRGFILSHKPWCECVYPNTNPYPHEIDPTLRIFVSPGEYEPLTFEVRAFRPLRRVQVVPGDLGPIGASAIDIRHVRYMKARPNYDERYSYRIVPDILEPFQSLDLPADETHRFWLTAHAPENAKPGLYSGAIALRCESPEGEKISARIPVQLRVLDIKLREDPDRIFGIYYDDPIDQWVKARDEVSKGYFWHKSEMEHADMAAHGIRNVTLDAWLRPENEEGRFVADWTALKAKIDLARRYDFKPPFVVSLNTEGVYEKHMKERYGSHLDKIQMPPQAFFEEMTRMAAFVESERVKNGWAQFLYYPVDEPGRSETAVRFMAALLQAVRQAGVKTYLTADPTADCFQSLRPYVDVWCTQPFNPDRETILQDMASRGVQYWCYPNHVSGENDHTPVAGARMTFGFGFWRSGFKALIPWIYSASSGDPFNYLDGRMMDFMNRHDENGAPMPVVLWEAFREGYDDYRYVFTLQSRIAEARATGRAQAAAEAEKQLDCVWNAIGVQEKYQWHTPWAPEDFDAYRWILARAILSLQSDADAADK